MEEQPKHPDVAAMFNQLLDVLDLNAAQFAKRIGSAPQVISNYMRGSNEPGRKVLALIIKAYPNIDAAWLATGEGNPFPDGRFPTRPMPVPNELKEVAAQQHAQSLTPAQQLHAESETLLKLAVAEANLEQTRKQLADKDKLIDRLWNMIPQKLGKLMSSLEAAHGVRIPYSYGSGAMASFGG